jgi:hypothetical protein
VSHRQSATELASLVNLGRILLQYIISDVLKATPFQVVYGRTPPLLPAFTKGTAKVAAVDKQMWDKDMFLAEVKDQCFRLKH